MHAAGLTVALACHGRTSAAQREIANDAVVTCLWCVSGMRDPELRWFKWGDGT